MAKRVNNQYKVDIRPSGRNGPRFRKSFTTQAEALAFERHVMAKHADAKPWQPQAPDRRTLAQLIETWHKLHGKNLKRGDARRTYLLNLCTLAGNPRATDITPKTYADLRKRRLDDGAGSNTVNHDLSYLKAMFNELERLGEWHQPNPFARIRRIKTDETELTYLEQGQIADLLAELDQHPASHARITARVCLATGARWGEAATLKSSQVRNGKVTFTATKNTKSRSIPISPELAELVLSNTPLVDGYNTFKRAVANLDLDLPSGQLSHVLRHTFASWFMIKGGNLLSLQRILGHSSIQMTVRYAHLAPDHMEDALTLNPLSDLSTQ